MSTCYHAPADPDSTRRRRCFLDRNQDERNVRATLCSPVDQPISIVPVQRANLRSATLRAFARAPGVPPSRFCSETWLHAFFTLVDPTGEQRRRSRLTSKTAPASDVPAGNTRPFNQHVGSSDRTLYRKAHAKQEVPHSTKQCQVHAKSAPERGRLLMRLRRVRFRRWPADSGRSRRGRRSPGRGRRGPSHQNRTASYA